MAYAAASWTSSLWSKLGPVTTSYVSLVLGLPQQMRLACLELRQVLLVHRVPRQVYHSYLALVRHTKMPARLFHQYVGTLLCGRIAKSGSATGWLPSVLSEHTAPLLPLVSAFSGKQPCGSSFCQVGP